MSASVSRPSALCTAAPAAARCHGVLAQEAGPAHIAPAHIAPARCACTRLVLCSHSHPHPHTFIASSTFPCAEASAPAVPGAHLAGPGARAMYTPITLRPSTMIIHAMPCHIPFLKGLETRPAREQGRGKRSAARPADGGGLTLPCLVRSRRRHGWTRAGEGGGGGPGGTRTEQPSGHDLGVAADPAAFSPNVLFRSLCRGTARWGRCVAPVSMDMDGHRPCGKQALTDRSTNSKQPRRVRPAAGARGCTGAAPLHTLRFALALAPPPGPRKRRSCLDTCGQNGRQRRRRDRVFGRAGDKWAVGPASEGTERAKHRCRGRKREWSVPPPAMGAPCLPLFVRPAGAGGESGSASSAQHSHAPCTLGRAASARSEGLGWDRGGKSAVGRASVLGAHKRALGLGRLPACLPRCRYGTAPIHTPMATVDGGAGPTRRECTTRRSSARGAQQQGLGAMCAACATTERVVWVPGGCLPGGCQALLVFMPRYSSTARPARAGLRSIAGAAS